MRGKLILLRISKSYNKVDCSYSRDLACASQSNFGYVNT